MLLLLPLATVAADYREEERIDKSIGLLERPWRVNHLRLNTRARQPAQVRPGLPPYKQQPETAQTAPLPSPM
jgi:hypothetical protein